MNIEQAIIIITNATAMVNAPRQFHVEVLQAIELIKGALTEKQVVPVDTKS